ncbi:MAG: hypothetical protein DME26_20880 [Verrucomicrobia bacterium]|nr:MAG: hypothetical protein DME26_20880 [Verrucomicrobiota bacterium]
MPRPQIRQVWKVLRPSADRLGRSGSTARASSNSLNLPANDMLRAGRPRAGSKTHLGARSSQAGFDRPATLRQCSQ